MLYNDWNAKLNEAHSVEGVLRVVSEFLSGWTPEELEVLPADCRPPTMKHADDVAAYALDLVQRHMKDDSSDPAAVHAMANFFVAASTRASQIVAAIARKAAFRRERV